MVYKTPGITRSQLCQNLNINKSIATLLTGFLEENGWLVSPDAQTKKQPLYIASDRLNVAGVDIQPEFCNLVICDLEGNKRYEKSWARDSNDLEGFLSVVLPYYLHEAGLEIAALGIALPGIIDSSSHTLLASQPLNVTAPLALPGRIGTKNYPVFYDNDARCIGWALVSFRKESGNFLLHYMNLIEHDPPRDEWRRIVHGMALFFDGKAFEGSNHRAGEVRMQNHLTRTNGVQTFGNYLTRLSLKSKPDLFRKYLDSLVFDIGYHSTLLDVDKVFIAGSLGAYQEDISRQFDAVCESCSYYPAIHRIAVEFPELSGDSMALGAAGMAIERLFSVPVTENPSEFYRSVAEGRVAGKRIEANS